MSSSSTSAIVSPTAPDMQDEATQSVTTALSTAISAFANSSDNNGNSSWGPSATVDVQEIFGSSVGPSWGDFFCTLNRMRGRLYATGQALLFYTNLLGFERRICLMFRDVEKMELYKTTSLRITMIDDEVYIFKSFNNREQVLHLLNGLKLLADKHAAARHRLLTAPSTVSDSKASKSKKSKKDKDNSAPLAVFTLPTVVSVNPASPIPIPRLHMPNSPSIRNFNRRRSTSDSMLRSLTNSQNGIHHNASADNLPYENNVDGNRRRRISHATMAGLDLQEDDDSCNGYADISMTIDEDMHDPSIEAAWNDAKKSRDPKVAEVGAQNEVVPCSVSEYYSTFIEDEAPYSLDRFQRDHIKDTNVEITGWDVHAEGCLTRTITFIHPIRNAKTFGPSSAETKRVQKLRRFGKYGIIIENTTNVHGIPASDSFHVQDFWLIEAGNHENEVIVSIWFDAIFTKRSLLKHIIQKSIRSETKIWIKNYLVYVRSALQPSLSQPAELVCTIIKDEPKQRKSSIRQSIASILSTNDTSDASELEHESTTLTAHAMMLFVAIIVAVGGVQFIILYRQLVQLQSDFYALKATLEHQRLVCDG